MCIYVYITLQDEVSIYAHIHMEKTKHPLQVRRAVSGQLRPQALSAPGDGCNAIKLD